MGNYLSHPPTPERPSEGDSDVPAQETEAHYRAAHEDPQRTLNFEEVTTKTSIPPASANTARSTQTSLQARNQQGTETKRRPIRVPSTSTLVVQELSTNDEDNNHEMTPPSPTPERPRSPTPAPTNMALVTYVPNPKPQPEPEIDWLKRMATEDEDPADFLRRHVAQVQQYQAAARLL